jgi:tRNA A37 threonylcarbamoyltransferase TsaD
VAGVTGARLVLRAKHCLKHQLRLSDPSTSSISANKKLRRRRTQFISSVVSKLADRIFIRLNAAMIAMRRSLEAAKRQETMQNNDLAIRSRSEKAKQHRTDRERTTRHKARAFKYIPG